MRFIAFGCSHTWGSGITQADKDGLYAASSEYAWPVVLGKKFNIPVINYALPGGSNHNILNKVRNHNWQKDDIALVLFTYFTRYTSHEDNTTIMNILPNYTNERPSVTAEDRREKIVNRAFYKLFNEYHLEKINLIDIEHAYLYFKYHNIPYVTRFANRFDIVDEEATPEIINDITDNLRSFALARYTEENMRGYDGSHYSKQVHADWADSLVEPVQQIISNLKSK